MKLFKEISWQDYLGNFPGWIGELTTVNWWTAASAAIVATIVFYSLNWPGLVILAFAGAALVSTALLGSLRAIVKLLEERLRDRCSVCHREILDEGGVIYKHGVFHDSCLKRVEHILKADETIAP